ncbi:hypothetical protein [Microcystis sp. M42BS1]|uniref:phage tail fiber protein n=1 Tax=Microcystis sp. M42BS1 TaxID=2771192 RepID=UPI00258F9F3E|nr:hypothetical protein [Microcystis sp. M42BS1]MCA2570701.1 hypothetical protein [Microcystis sp. M42BS1]
MSALTDTAENQLVDWFFRGQPAPTLPASWHVALFTVAPGDSGGGTEVSGGAYARVAVTRNLTNWAGTQSAGSTTASTGNTGATSNNAAITFPAPTANWGTVVAVGLFDAASGGNLWAYATLGQNRIINNGDPAPNFPISQLVWTFA